MESLKFLPQRRRRLTKDTPGNFNHGGRGVSRRFLLLILRPNASVPYCGVFWGSHHAAFDRSTRSRVLSLDVLRVPPCNSVVDILVVFPPFMGVLRANRGGYSCGFSALHVRLGACGI
jgi:hypothetical protein